MADKKTKNTKKKPAENLVEIPAINIGRGRFTIVGTTPLLCDRMREEVLIEIEGDQTGRAKLKKPPRDPQAEYRASKYKAMFGKRELDAFPASGVKDAMVEAAPYCRGLDKKLVRGAVHMCAEFFILRHQNVNFHSALGRNSGRSSGRVPRYRSEYHGWEIDVEFEHNKNLISAEQIAGLLKLAGFSIGIGNWTPQKSGFRGKFTVK